MRSLSPPFALLPVVLLLAGCGGLGKVGQAFSGGGEDPLASAAGQIPDHLRAGGSQQARIRLAPMGADPAAFARSQGESAQASLLTPEEDIVWTDPDNPDAELPEIEDLIRASKNQDDWSEVLVAAQRHALREGLPLLLWFTDSRRSSICKTLSNELLATQEFDSWARAEVVRVRLDWNVKGEGGDLNDKMDAEARRRDYLETLERRYRVTGKPHIVIMAPDGTVTGRYRGYRTGSSEFFWGKLKHSVGLAQKHHDKWVAGMREKGYRMWTSARGDFSSFAKLTRYWRGQLVLVEPGGASFRTREENLSRADREWIEREKAKRR